MFKALVRSAPRDVKPFARSFASSCAFARLTAKTKTSNQTSVLATLSKTQALFKTYKPVTPSLRHLRRPISPHLYEGPPIRALTIAKRKKGGRNNHGHVTVRHRGGGHRRRIRVVDFKRVEPGKQDVVRIEFDPGRSAHIALLRHRNPDAKMLWSYILAPEDLRAGDAVESFREGIPDGLVAGFTDKHWKGRRTGGSTDINTTTAITSSSSISPSPHLDSAATPPSIVADLVDASFKSEISEEKVSLVDDESRQLSIGILRALVIRPGNVLPLRAIPPGTVIHAIALDPNGPAILVRSAGSFATIISQDAETEKGGKYTQVKLQSGEIRHILSSCCATIGRVSNPNWKDRSLGKAGRSRNLGWRPSVRGMAMNAYVLISYRDRNILFVGDGLLICFAEWITLMGVVEVNRKVTSILDQSGAGRRKGEERDDQGPRGIQWLLNKGPEARRGAPVNPYYYSRTCLLSTCIILQQPT